MKMIDSIRQMIVHESEKIKFHKSALKGIGKDPWYASEYGRDHYLSATYHEGRLECLKELLGN